jgi:hypothetical protein
MILFVDEKNNLISFVIDLQSTHQDHFQNQYTSNRQDKNKSI